MRNLLLLLTLLLSAAAARAVSYSGTLPVLFISTENGQAITSKDTYLKATYYLDNMGIEGVEPVGTATEPLTMQIRGRGNYSWWGFDKKPYRIKLDTKQALLGMNKSKHFALLAHADDTFGFMRNAVGFQISRLIGMPWTPADAPLEVVLNGDYIGLYFLTETIRVDKDRVDIVEQADLATAPDEITGGWLVEIDNYEDDPHITLYEKDAEHSKITFTYKTPEELSDPQKAYLTDQMTAINDAVYRPDLNDNAWEEYVDTDILARYYITQEVVDDFESFHGSCYLYKNRGDGKWMFGPVWDFGNAFTFDKTQYIYKGRQWHNTWIEQMCRHPHFMETVKAVWADFRTARFNEIYGYIDTYAERIKAAAVCDAERWPSYGCADVAAKASTVKDRLRASERWLQSQWGELPTYTAYYQNNLLPYWNEVHAYVWYTTNNAVVTLNGGWPGHKIELDAATGYYKLSFKSDELPDNTMIIFNNGNAKGDNQTADLEFIDGGIYNRRGFIGLGAPDIAATGLEISVRGGAIVVNSESNGTVTITDVAGRSISREITGGENIIDGLAPGIYFVGGRKIALR